MKIVFSPESRQDLREIFNYIAKDNLDAAIAFVRRLKQRCVDLAPMPNVGKNREEIARGYRSITEGDYVIFYRLQPEIVEILHVVHGKRDLSKVLSK